MTIERMCLKVVSPIGGMRFVANIGEDISIDHIKKTEEYSYATGEIMDAFAERKNDMGAVTHWRVTAKGHHDVIVTVNELNSWRHECVIEVASVV